MNNSITHLKTKAFAIRIIHLYKFLTDEKHEFILSKQLLRCGTSIGANTHENNNAQSKLDFIHKLSIALKEADETSYWLDLLVETNYIEQDLFESIKKDLKEIIALLTASIKTSKQNLNT